MKNLLFAALPAAALLLAAPPASAAPGSWRPAADTVGERPSGPGAAVLWNGRDLQGWSVFLQDPQADPGRAWSVADGALRLTGRPYGYLRSDRDYANFHLHVEWRYPAGTAAKSANSGVFVLVHGKNAIWPQGVECQLRVGEAGQMIGTEVVLPGAPFLKAKWRAPALHPSPERPIGQWNAYDIRCFGRAIEVWVNSVLQNRFEGVTFKSDPQLRPLRGAILLQLEGAPIEFRNIWLEDSG